MVRLFVKVDRNKITTQKNKRKLKDYGSTIKQTWIMPILGLLYTKHDLADLNQRPSHWQTNERIILQLTTVLSIILQHC